MLRERLRPNYRAACKRLVISPDFYQAIQRPNAELVTEGIERVEAERRASPATAGSTSSTCSCSRRASASTASCARSHVIGRDGRRLDDAWARRPTAYLSISIPGFPNLFMLNGPNGPVGNFSLIEVAELQLAYILKLLERSAPAAAARSARARRTTERFDAERVEAAKRTVWSTGCRSWYLDDRGIPAVWPWTFDRFREEMAAPKLEAYELGGGAETRSG